MKRRVVTFLAAAMAFVGITLAQVPGQGLFYLGGDDPWWRPLNPQGQSYGITVGSARPSPPMNGEIFLDMDGAADGGPKLEVYDGTNAEWDGVSIAELALLDDVTITTAAAGDILMHNGTAWVDATTLTGAYNFSGTVDINTLTDNTVPFHNDATGNLVDSAITDTGTVIALGGTTVDFAASGLFNMSADGSAAATAITFGASSTADVQMYFDGDSFVIDADGTTTNDIDLIAGATGDITLTTDQLDILDALPYIGVQDDALMYIGDVTDASSATYSGYVAIQTNSTGSDGAGRVEIGGQVASGSGGEAIHFIAQADGVNNSLGEFNFEDQSPLMDGSDSKVMIRLRTANGNATGSGNDYVTMNFDSITADAEKVNTAIEIDTNYDYGLSIFGDGSATDDNITLGASKTADAQIYFDGSALTFDVDGAAANNIIFAQGIGGTTTFNSAVVHQSYRQDFDGACWRGAVADHTIEDVADGSVNAAICDGGIKNFTYRLELAQASPFLTSVTGQGLDIDNDGADNSGVEILLAASQNGTTDSGWYIRGQSPAMYARFNVTIASVSGTDDFVVGWRLQEAFDAAATSTNYDTFAVHKISDNAGNLQIVTDVNGAADGVDENDVQAAFGDGETHTFEVRLSTACVATFYTNGSAVTISNANDACEAGDIMVPFIMQRLTSDVDAETVINWIEIGEVI